MNALRIPSAVFGALALVSPQHAAAAREPLRLSPSSEWVVDYGDESCRLLSEFGQGNTKVTLIISQFAPGDWFRVTVAGRSIVPRTSEQPLKGELRYGPAEESIDTEAMPGKIGSVPALFLMSPYRIVPLTPDETEASRRAREAGEYYEPASVDPSREKAATWLEISRMLKRDIVLETGPMDRPMNALRECSRDMVRSWGLDVDQQETLSRRPFVKAESKHWLNPSDYPAAMALSGHQAFVHFRIMIDEQGRPTSCHIQGSTRPKDFDQIVCRSAMRRATFEPALDAAGQPVPSYSTITVSFRVQ